MVKAPALRWPFYLTLSALLNVLFFSLFFKLLVPKAEPPPPPSFITVDLKEVKPPPPPPPPKRAEKPAPVKAEPAEAGELPVASKKEVSVLKELKERVLKRVEELRRAKKEVGELSAVLKGRRVEIEAGSRKLVFVPPAPVFEVEEFPSAVRVKIWVNADGRVVKAALLQRSGIAEVDEEILRFVKKLRFEPVEHEGLQEGVVVFRFASS
ncbi:MAG: TonB family protein [Aquificae bacterium]|nr:TonB family protein [Aquificota bacterium]